MSIIMYEIINSSFFDYCSLWMSISWCRWLSLNDFISCYRLCSLWITISCGKLWLNDFFNCGQMFLVINFISCDKLYFLNNFLSCGRLYSLSMTISCNRLCCFWTPSSTGQLFSVNDFIRCEQPSSFCNNNYNNQDKVWNNAINNI